VQGTPGEGGVQLRGAVGITPTYTGQEIKIVWRVTGSGPLTLTATGPDEQDRPLVWGPDPHEDSDFKRPGQEWGAGYRFDRPGCWRLRATRGPGWADVWLNVYAG
jgi:hypothetical protein